MPMEECISTKASALVLVLDEIIDKIQSTHLLLVMTMPTKGEIRH
jgi:hypothetical protein